MSFSAARPIVMAPVVPAAGVAKPRLWTRIFAEELARQGITSRMDQAYAQERADLPPMAKSA